MFPKPYHPDFPVGYITLNFTPAPPSVPRELSATFIIVPRFAATAQVVPRLSATAQVVPRLSATFATDRT